MTKFFFLHKDTIRLFYLNNQLNEFPRNYLCLKTNYFAGEFLQAWKMCSNFRKQLLYYFYLVVMFSHCINALLMSNVIMGKTSSQWLVNKTLVLWAKSGQYSSDHKFDSNEICSDIAVQCCGYFCMFTNQC